MDGTLIYAKTPKGVAEVAARTAQLPMTSRRVLIMMDGKRTLDELAVLVKPGEIDAIVTQLESAGLAQKANEAAAPADGRGVEPEPPATVATTVIDERELSPITLEEAKRRAVRELNERLGPEAEVIALRIEACRTIEEFRERVREAERFVATALGAAGAQDYLRALRRRP
jgi:predicted dinucleotide-utilizing enzyme